MATRRIEQAERTQVTPARAGAGGNGTFTLDEVKALVQVLEGTDVTSLRWDRNGQKIVIRRGQQAPVMPAVLHHAAPVAMPAPIPAALAPVAAPAAAPAAAAPAPAPKAEAKPGTIVTSPFVGTFY